MTERLIDLHCHTTMSDGTLTPADIARLAKETGLSALAITDHDTTDAWPEFSATAAEIGLEPITGVELSTTAILPNGRQRRLDLLGYLFDPAAPSLAERLQRMRNARGRRNDQMIEKLREHGMEITLEEVAAQAGGRVVGRPHFARVLVNKGYVKDASQAFTKWLGDDAAGYVPRVNLSTEDAIGIVVAAGGKPVLAHPGEVHLDDQAWWDELLTRFKVAGLAGIEVNYAEHGPDKVKKFGDLAKKHELVATGGSDFHGDNRPGVRLGRGRGGLRISYAVLDALRRG